MARVAIYCRLSEEDRYKVNPQEDSESIQNQKSMLLGYAGQHGWEIYNLYCDEDFSGSDRHRPEFLKMLADAEKRKFDIVLCKTQSRFSRELEMVEKYIHGLFPEWGIRFVSVVDNADTAVKGNKKSRQINGLVSEWYLEDLSENVRSVLTDKRKKGQHIGSFALYGYQKDEKQKNHLVLDPEAAEVVRLIYSFYQQGYGGQKIANMLNDRLIPNPATYKIQHGSNYHPAKLSSKGSCWSYTTVIAILRNQMYAGDLVQGKLRKMTYKSDSLRRTDPKEWIIVPDTHEAIIPRQQWQQVQEQLDSRRKPGKEGNVHIFAGKVKCMECGRALHSHLAKGIKYLRCPTSDSSKKLCQGCCIQLPQLERYVLNELNSLIRQYFDAEQLREQVELPSRWEEKIKSLQAQKNSCQKQFDEAGQALKNLYLDKLRGVLTEELFQELSVQFHEEKQTLTRRLEEVAAQLEAVEQQRRQQASREEVIRKYRQISSLTRPIVCELIQEIQVGKKDPQTKQIPIKIFWNI